MDYPALVLFDIFKGQCTNEVYDLLTHNNNFYIIIPANCTDKFQPLDLSINKAAKNFMKRGFHGRVINQQWLMVFVRKLI